MYWPANAKLNKYEAEKEARHLNKFKEAILSFNGKKSTTAWSSDFWLTDYFYKKTWQLAGYFQHNDVWNNRFKDLKLKREEKWVRHWNCYTIANSKLSVGTCGRGLWNNRSFIDAKMLAVADRKPSSSVSCALWFLFLDLACFMVENALSHTFVRPNIACIFSVKSFSLGNISLLTNLQKVFRLASLTPLILYILSKSVMLVRTKIIYRNTYTKMKTEKARGPWQFCPRATCGPRACSWTTLVYNELTW